MNRIDRDGKTFVLYFFFTAFCALFFFLGDSAEPFAMALLFAAMCARLSPAIACGCYTLSSAVAGGRFPSVPDRSDDSFLRLCFKKENRKKSRLPALYLVVSRACRIRIFRAVYALYSAARIFVLKRRNRTENRHRGIDISPVCGIFRSAARSFIPLFEMQTENG